MLNYRFWSSRLYCGNLCS
ncbi:UNVERIFIED_CONTAM: hypothetical protein GTU68_029401 [Idotea baltica]|nr:hypothetical protein [Idotea baltica]